MTTSLDTLATLILDALRTEHEAGLALGRFVYDHHTNEAELTEAKAGQEIMRRAKVGAMWSAFYDLASVAVLPTAEHVAAVDSEQDEYGRHALRAGCSCGWAGDDLHPDEDTAQDEAAAHVGR